MRDIIIRAVEAADGWQFIPSHSFVKAPGLTEPMDVMRMPPLVISGLSDQLVFQIDQSERFTFCSEIDGRCTVINSEPKDDEPDRSSFHGDSRAVNTLRAIEASKFFS